MEGKTGRWTDRWTENMAEGEAWELVICLEPGAPSIRYVKCNSWLECGIVPMHHDEQQHTSHDLCTMMDFRSPSYFAMHLHVGSTRGRRVACKA